MTIRVMSALLISLSALMLLIFYAKTYSIEKYRKNLGTGMFLNVACNMVYFFFLLRPNEIFAHIAYGVYQSLLICSLFCLLWFCAKYFCVVNKLKLLFNVVALAISADIVLVLKNSMFEQNVVYKHLRTKSGEILITLGEKWAFQLHETLCLVLAFMGVLLIALVLIKSKGYIRKRNALLFIILLMSFVAELFVLRTDYPFDLGSISIGSSFIIIYLFTFIYEPTALLKETLQQVSISMNEYLLVFDKENHCIFTSDSAKSMVEKDEDRENVENKMNAWISSHKNLTSNVVNNYPIVIDNKLRNFHVSIHIFRSSQSAIDTDYTGSFVILLDQTEERLLHDKLRYASTHDELTGLYNFDYFSKKASEHIAVNSAEKYVMVEFDIKEFKLIADQFNEYIADIVLKHIADVIRTQYNNKGVYCRQGKDQFYALVNEKDFSMEQLQEIIQEMQSFHFPNEFYRIHVYAGVYYIESNDESIRSICDCCYRAICRIKGGYESIQLYDDQTKINAIYDQFISCQVLDAIEQNNIEIYLQVQVDNNNKVMGAEALSRWHDPEKGYIAPQQFIPILEHNGLIYKLDQYVWELSCKTIKKWNEHQNNDFYIAVNISPVDIHYLDVYAELTGLVKKYGISNKQLRIEITESEIAKAPDKLLSLIYRLRDAGFIVEMDDFGDGYSSLNMLKDTSIDVVKLDMKFLKGIPYSRKSKVVVQTVLNLCKSLHISTIAEGVETPEQADFLKNNGCQAMQGYLFSKPIPVEEFEQSFIKM